MIIHITSAEDWNNAIKKGVYTAPSLNTEGFIHCSTKQQTVDTANLFFRGMKGLILLFIDEKQLSAEVKYEPPTGGALHKTDAGDLFPHVYGPINISAVIRIISFPPDQDGLFKWPEME